MKCLNFEAGLNCHTVGLRSMRQQETKGGTGVGTSIMLIKIINNYIQCCSLTLRGIVVLVFTKSVG